MKKNLFLNKKYLIKWTENQTAFLVQSPFNPNAGIWWPKNWFSLSPNWPDTYFSTGIVLDQEYDEIIYCDKGIERINKITGQQLYDQFKTMIAKNKIKYLKMALETANKLKALSDSKIVPNYQPPNNDLIQKLSW